MTPATDTSRARVVALVGGVLIVLILGAGVVTAVARSGSSSSTGRTASVAPTTSPAVTAPPTSPPPPAQPDEPAYITEIKAQVSELRGLAWKSPLTVDIVSRDELARRTQAANDRDRRPERMAGDEDMLKLLHLIPADLDLTKTIDQLITGVIKGFYDPKTKELVVGDAGEGDVDASTKVALAHELDHALTDQWFDFGGRTQVLDDADRQEEGSGFVARIEGDAKYLEHRFADTYLSEEEQLAYALGSLVGGDVDPDAAAAVVNTPAFILKALYFPYEDGLAFVEAQAGGGPDVNAGIDAAYRHPPTSTEQILHPDTYATDQGWSAPDLVDVAAATGCERRRRNTFGEFTMREVLDRELDGATAEAGARGWNGDVFETVRCGSRLGMVERWQADTDTDAARLTSALNEWAPQWAESGAGGTARVTRNASVVTLVLGADAATADRLAAAASD